MYSTRIGLARGGHDSQQQVIVKLKTTASARRVTRAAVAIRGMSTDQRCLKNRNGN